MHNCFLALRCKADSIPKNFRPGSIGAEADARSGKVAGKLDDLNDLFPFTGRKHHNG